MTSERVQRPIDRLRARPAQTHLLVAMTALLIVIVGCTESTQRTDTSGDSTSPSGQTVAKQDDLVIVSPADQLNLVPNDFDLDWTFESGSGNDEARIRAYRLEGASLPDVIISTVNVLPDIESATRTYNDSLGSVSKRSATKSLDVGDEAFLWAEANFYEVQFRYQNVLGTVQSVASFPFSGSERNAKKWAETLADRIAKEGRLGPPATPVPMNLPTAIPSSGSERTDSPLTVDSPTPIPGPESIVEPTATAVQVNTPELIADFVVDQSSGRAPFTVNFTDSSTGNPGSWTWDMGDGTEEVGQNPTHTYFTAGTYSVTLFISGEVGEDQRTRQSIITVDEPGWTRLPDMSSSRYVMGTVRLQDGTVLAVGGRDTGTHVATNTVEGFSPQTSQWSSLSPLTLARDNTPATVLPDGNVLVAGGSGPGGPYLSSEVFDTSTGSWTLVGSLSAPRSLHTATLLPSGGVFDPGWLYRSLRPSAICRKVSPRRRNFHQDRPN